MKTAGKAFTMGVFGTLGIATAILVPIGVAVIVGEKKLKKIFRDFEKEMRDAQETLITGIHPDSRRDTMGNEDR